ncbi:MAG: hypothetical protein ACLFRV_08340 [Acidimicrobiales bacterium]
MTTPCGDPLFQLNAVLWMLQPLPTGSTAVNAVLHHQGYAVRSMGQSLTAGAELERRLAVDLGLRGAPAPDVLASAPAGDPWPIFECKRSSFGAESSTSDQASKVLARGADLSLTAGAAPGQQIAGCVVFVTRDDQAVAVQDTLDELRATLHKAGVAAASAATVGIRVETGVGVSAQVKAGTFPGAGGIALAEEVVVVPAAGQDEDARPLYLVPFDPSVEQDEEERARCLRILLARGQAHAASMVGRGPAQGTVVLQAHELIDAATYGLARYWRDSSARDRAAQEILRFAKSALASMRKSKAPMVSEGNGPKRLEVVIQSADHRQDCAEAVMSHPLPGEPDFPPYVEDELPFADAAGPRGSDSTEAAP